MQSLTSAHLRSPNANAESDGYDPCTTRPPPTPTPRQDRTEPDAPVVASCTFARIPGFPIPVPEAASSRVRACMLWQRGAHISLNPIPHLIAVSPPLRSGRATPSILTTTFPSPYKRIIILIRNTAPPRLHPHSGSTCLFVLGFRIAYKYLLLPSCFTILLSVSGLYALFSFTSFLALYLHSTVFPSPLSLTALPLLVAYTVNLYVCMYICTYAPP